MSTIETAVFGNRKVLIGLFAAVTIAMSFAVTNVHFDTAFEKHLPLSHPYIKTFLEYDQEFGGANRLLIAIHAKQGDIFTAPFFETIEAVTNEVRFLPGINQSTVRSIFTPNVRFIEVAEGGFTGGNVVPADFRPTPEGLAQVRENIQKSAILGRLVADDFTAVMIEAQLLEKDVITGRKFDHAQIASHLERKVLDKYAGGNVDIHIIGFAKVVADIAAGAAGVVMYFGVAFLVTAVLVYIFSHSIYLAILPLLCSVMAVVWTMGLWTLLGFGLDPMSILVPFLIFAIGVSHGLQMINQFFSKMHDGANNVTAARGAFRQILVPGGVALGTDALGFLTVLLIDIKVIQEFAMISIIGVAIIVCTNLFLLPVLLSYAASRESYRTHRAQSSKRTMRFWQILGRTSEPKIAVLVIVVAIGLFVLGLLEAREVKVGDSDIGVPELHPDSRYNRDSVAIAEKFSIGMETLLVFTETMTDGCLDYEVMAGIDRFQWQVANIQGVTFTYSMPQVAKMMHAAFNEGHPKWRTLPRNKNVLRQAISPIEPSTGLLNQDCSVIPIFIFLENHKEETIDRVVTAVHAFQKEHNSARYAFRLASGNVGVMAATNDVIRDAQAHMLGGIYAAVATVCLLIFRSWRITLCIVTPLALVSFLAYGLMHLLEIGLKISTLPVVALGVGIGVDYGIYLFSRLNGFLNKGLSLHEAYQQTLQTTGQAVFMTGLTLAIGVSTWVFSGLKFQADMGLLLSFLFLANMLGALLLLPALACVFYSLFRPKQPC